jgi:hypothetical protein
MDMGVLYQRRFEVRPGESETFVVYVAGERQLSGEGPHVYGFSNVHDLLTWMQNHAEALLGQKSNSGGPGERTEKGSGRDESLGDALTTAALIQDGTLVEGDIGWRAIENAINVLSRRAQAASRAGVPPLDNQAGRLAIALRRQLPLVHPQWLAPEVKDDAA